MNDYDSLDRPLFGVSTRRERLLNLIVGTTVSLLVIVTIVMSLISDRGDHKANDVFFSFCIAFVCGSLILLIFWYREGDLDPKFKKMIYLNSATVVLLCICANVYYAHPQTSQSNCTVT